MVEQYWHGEDPVGKRLQVRGRSMRVVGVARLSNYRNFLETPKSFFYVPLRQNFFAQVALNSRTSLSPQTMSTLLAREVRALDPKTALFKVIPMREQLDRSTSAQRSAGTLLSVFGGLALLVAAVGLYGAMSYTVSQGTRELGLRMVFGARQSDLLRLVISYGLVLAAGGVTLGWAAAFGLTRLLGYLLYKVSPHDPLAVGSAFVLMMITALAASLLPAWRATRTDPAKVLRD
jgi:ABC-type antimicrobial peptide transport system permease subunit